MARSFHKKQPIIPLSEFLEKACKVKLFSSSTGKRYKVVKIENDELSFVRLDANQQQIWQMNLKDLYQAYEELEDFATKNFKPFVPITHSPGRGLLLHLQLLH
jgi:hypothetical protein